jgi:hypothetical protein
MPDEKKLIIDEDWKSQVQAEKARAAAGEAASATGPSPSDLEDAGDFPMPPATLELLLTTLATEALMSLGQIPHPATGQLTTHRNQAKYLIDTIDILRQKTKGNLTPDEQQTIDSLLHQLRMVFIQTGGAPQAGDVRTDS